MKKWICALQFFLMSVIATAQQIASDDFERANLGSNWTVYFGAGTIEIVDSSDLGFPANNNAFGLLGWTATAFAANQYSEIIISSNRPDSVLTQAFVRRRNSDGARYGFHWNPGFGGRWEIKYDGVAGPQTRLLDSVTGTGPAGGDTLRIEISGMTISGFFNGALMLQATDTAFSTSNPITTTGIPGIAFAYGAQAPVFPAAVIEQWNGGELSQTAINYLDNNSFAFIFPNPASKVVKITSKNFSCAELFSAEGKKVLVTNQKVLNVSHLLNGIYFLKIISAGNICIKKIIVQQNIQ